ncbi:MAG TPA: hypothetical protein VIH45_02600 [Desulfuromonadaceae bacterium]
MRYGHISLFTAACCFLAWTALAQGPDAPASLKRFSDFPKVDVKLLLGGEILAQRGTATKFPNGISAQFCFTMPIPPAETARLLQDWDSTGVSGTNVYAHAVLHPPGGPGDFKKFHLDTTQGPTRWLVEKTLAVGSGASELNLSRGDAQHLGACVKKSPNAQGVSGCWTAMLAERAAAFQRNGFNGVAPYDAAETPFNQIEQLRSMLREQTKVVEELSPVLVGAGLVHGTGDAPRLTPFHYWSLFSANHHAVVNLGAIYSVAVADHYQVLDAEYYVSDGYYAATTLYEIWPIPIAGGTASLVWRGDFYVTPMMSFLKGLERIAYGAIMIQEIKHEIRMFQAYPGAQADTRPTAGLYLP